MQNQNSTSPFLSQNIFVELGLANASEETKMQLLDQMNELIEKRLIVRILENATPEQQAAINSAAERSDEELFAAMLSATPDFPQYLEEEIVRVREEMKQSMPQQ